MKKDLAKAVAERRAAALEQAEKEAIKEAKTLGRDVYRRFSDRVYPKDIAFALVDRLRGSGGVKDAKAYYCFSIFKKRTGKPDPRSGDYYEVFVLDR